MPTKDTLSLQQEQFVIEYLIDFNGTQAAIRSKYAPKSAHVQAHDLLRNPKVIREIRTRLDNANMGKKEALSILAQHARGDIGMYVEATSDGRDFELDLRDKDGNVKPTSIIKKIKQKTKRHIRKDGGEEEVVETTLELYDAQKAAKSVLKVYALDEEIHSGEISAVDFSIPAHLMSPSFFDVYRDIRKLGHTEYLLFGGRGSTKSSFASLVQIELIINNPTMHGLATRQIGNTLRDSVYSQLRWAIGEMGLDDKFKCTVSPMEIEYLPTRQKIYFRGGDDPIKIKSIKPAFGYIGLLWFEELDQFRGTEAVRMIEQSAIRGGDVAFILKSFNPPRTASNWANKYTKVPKKTQYQHFSNYLDVPPEWLGKTFLEEAEHLKSINPMAYEHEYGGIATGTGGVVFENVQIHEITDEEIFQFDHVMRGLDWGYFPDPFSYGVMHYDAARMTLYIFNEYRAKKRSNRKVCADLVKQHGLTSNDLIIADSAEPKSIADFREYGANIRGAEKGADSVDYSMKWLQSLAAIVIDDRRAPYHAEEFLNYEFEQDKDGEFISAYPDKNNHAIDDIRYGTNPIWRRRGQ